MICISVLHTDTHSMRCNIMTRMAPGLFLQSSDCENNIRQQSTPIKTHSFCSCSNSVSLPSAPPPSHPHDISISIQFFGLQEPNSSRSSKTKAAWSSAAHCFKTCCSEVSQYSSLNSAVGGQHKKNRDVQLLPCG